MISKEIKLNVARIINSSYANGPGNRTVIWFQGCNLHCIDCYNSEMWPFIQKQILSPTELFKIIQENKNNLGIEGITLTGGEPILQSHQLIPFLQLVRKEGLSIFCYSGYDFTYIQDNFKDILKYIDILIAGPYRADLHIEDQPLIGSSNKKIFFLSNRYCQKDLKNITMEIHIEDQIRITGFPSMEFIDEIKNLLDNDN